MVSKVLPILILLITTWALDPGILHVSVFHVPIELMFLRKGLVTMHAFMSLVPLVLRNLIGSLLIMLPDNVIPKPILIPVA